MPIYIGTSGWSYDHWQGQLYPNPTPVARRLPYYLQKYDTVEVNNTFYRWPRDEVFSGWREQVPPDFKWTIKASRGLTHNRKLNEPEVWLERMLGGLRNLGDRLGVLLLQFPPQWRCNLPRLEYFLQIVPPWVKLAFEFRHQSWQTEEVFALLEKHDAAYCIMSGAHLPTILRATAPFVYLRFHGPDPEYLYAGSYGDEEMRIWAERINGWQQQGRDVFAYFNNDPHGHALRNADSMKQILGLPLEAGKTDP